MNPFVIFNHVTKRTLILTGMLLSLSSPANATFTCEEALTFWTSKGQFAPKRLLTKFRNDAQFEVWLRRHDFLAKPAEDSGDEILEDQLLRDFEIAKPDVAVPPDLHPWIKLKNFKREHAVRFTDERGRLIERNDHYDNTAANGLRRGVVVEFSDTYIKLGEFLGQGNSTMIFALHGNPAVAIRIPYLSTVLADRGLMVDTLIKRTVEAEPKIKTDRVRILGLGKNFEYILVDRVDATENGREFLWRIPPLLTAVDQYFDELEAGTVDAKLMRELARQAVGQCRFIEDRRLRRQVKNLIAATLRYPFEQSGFLLKGHRWILVDWY